jgi:hypothetical protein
MSHNQVAKMMDRMIKAIIRQFQVSPMSIILFILKFLKRLSSATNSNTLVITPTLKQDAKYFIYAQITKHTTSFAPTVPFFTKNISYVCGGISLIATPRLLYSTSTKNFTTIP